MRPLASVALAFLMAGCGGGDPSAAFPTGDPPIHATPQPTPSSAPQITPSTTPRPLTLDDPIRAVPAAPLPSDPHVIPTEDDELHGYRLWVIDNTLAAPSREIAQWTSWTGGMTSSSDAKRIVLAAGSREKGQRVYLLEPEQGRLRAIYDDPTQLPTSVAIAPDGSRVAFVVRRALDHGVIGIWGGRLPDGPFVPLVLLPIGERVSVRMAWSFDGAFLEYDWTTREYVSDVNVLSIRDGSVRTLGRAEWLTWSPTAHLLAVSRYFDPAVSEGRVLQTYDADRSTLTDLVRSPAGFIGEAAWAPSGDRFLIWEADQARDASGALHGGFVIRDLVGGIRPLGVAKLNGRAWWTGDGGRILGMNWVDAPTFPLIDLVSGRVLFEFCSFAGTPGSCRSR